MTLWIDVEDLFLYARDHARPTGIQRLAFELYRALVEAPGSDVRFVRHDALSPTFRVVDWTEVVAINDWIATSHSPTVANAAAQRRGVGPLLRRLGSWLPLEVHRPLSEAARAQLQAICSIGEAIRIWLSRSRRGAPKAAGSLAQSFTGIDLRIVAQPGDTLCCFGSPWVPCYSERVSLTVQSAQMRFALLVYDIIPLVKPEFQVRSLIDGFGTFMRTCLPIADRVLTISEATAKDVIRWTAQEDIHLRHPPLSIPIGTGFNLTPAATLPQGLTSGGYALVVSTIEARKNHLQVFRIWRRMLEEMPRERVPTLVFAGRVGWMVADLMQAIENTNWLDGKLVLVRQPEDSVLSALYRGCRFTLFPSYYEGWGLPVSESLAFGKTCIASNRTSLPEAGGEFCLYIDPDNTTEAYDIVRRAVEDPEIVGALEARIAARYRPTPWAATAAAVLKATTWTN